MDMIRKYRKVILLKKIYFINRIFFFKMFVIKIRILFEMDFKFVVRCLYYNCMNIDNMKI